MTVVDDEAPAPAPAEGPNKGLIIGLSVGGGVVLVGAAVAAMGAMEFKKKMAEDKTSCWEDYMSLCNRNSC